MDFGRRGELKIGRVPAKGRKGGAEKRGRSMYQPVCGIQRGGCLGGVGWGGTNKRGERKSAKGTELPPDRVAAKKGPKKPFGIRGTGETAGSHVSADRR